MIVPQAEAYNTAGSSKIIIFNHDQALHFCGSFLDLQKFLFVAYYLRIFVWIGHLVDTRRLFA